MRLEPRVVTGEHRYIFLLYQSNEKVYDNKTHIMIYFREENFH
jgi:hypothetical protein